MNVFINIDIFKSDLIDIDIDIDIFKKCRYIDNRYGLSIYRTPLGPGLLNNQNSKIDRGAQKLTCNLWSNLLARAEGILELVGWFVQTVSADGKTNLFLFLSSNTYSSPSRKAMGWHPKKYVRASLQ